MTGGVASVAFNFVATVTFASKFAGLDESVPLVLTAYRFHTQDPIIWHDDFVLHWQNGMERTGGLAAKSTALDFSVLIYEWANDASDGVSVVVLCNVHLYVVKYSALSRVPRIHCGPLALREFAWGIMLLSCAYQ